MVKKHQLEREEHVIPIEKRGAAEKEKILGNKREARARYKVSRKKGSLLEKEDREGLPTARPSDPFTKGAQRKGKKGNLRKRVPVPGTT